MKRIYKIIISSFLLLPLFSCEKDHGPSIDDHFLNYEIPEVPVTADYLVGMVYNYTVSSYGGNNEVIELFTTPPVLGRYSKITDPVTLDGESMQALDAHLKWMNDAKVDYLILTLRSGSTAYSSYKSDSTYIERILESPYRGNIKIAIQYDFSGLKLGSTAPSEKDQSMLIENKGLVDSYINDYVKFMEPFFKRDSYQRIGNKVLVSLDKAYQLYSADNIALTQNLRDKLLEAGYEIYLAGMQKEWTPPARYEHRLKGAVDAIYHGPYANCPSNDLSRVVMFPTVTDQAWKYAKNMFNGWGIEYIPDISPAWNGNLAKPNAAGNYYNPYIIRNADWFKTFCNVAKLNADGKRMIIVSSWNNWAYDSQMEPSEGYGTTFLDILRTQFKL